jgi:hypothetical protein
VGLFCIAASMRYVAPNLVEQLSAAWRFRIKVAAARRRSKKDEKKRNM